MGARCGQAAAELGGIGEAFIAQPQAEAFDSVGDGAGVECAQGGEDFGRKGLLMGGSVDFGLHFLAGLEAGARADEHEVAFGKPFEDFHLVGRLQAELHRPLLDDLALGPISMTDGLSPLEIACTGTAMAPLPPSP